MSSKSGNCSVIQRVIAHKDKDKIKLKVEESASDERNAKTVYKQNISQINSMDIYTSLSQRVNY